MSVEVTQYLLCAHSLGPVGTRTLTTSKVEADAWLNKYADPHFDRYVLILHPKGHWSYWGGPGV